ncbi:hypothetical protein, partial [Stutzerimonas nitrititolerans]|uniref:hypothetical protein n=1 Tax=Stutzerimonas nitrititolerans TaxID=2482751 RepID=UPI002899DC54
AYRTGDTAGGKDLRSFSTLRLRGHRPPAQCIEQCVPTREHGNDQRRVENGEAFSTRNEQATRLVEKTCGRFPLYDDRAKE